jgi:hypothetical protein
MAVGSSVSAQAAGGDGPLPGVEAGSVFAGSVDCGVEPEESPGVDVVVEPMVASCPDPALPDEEVDEVASTLGSFEVVVAESWPPPLVTVGTVGVVDPSSDDAPSTGALVCGVDGVVTVVDPTGTGGSEGAGTEPASGSVGETGVTGGVSVLEVCASVEDVVAGGALETTVWSSEVTGSVEVSAAGCVSSDVEKNVYVTSPEAGGVDDGAGVAGADAGADAGAGVGVAPAASVGIPPTVSTTVGAFANGSGLLVLDVGGIATFVCTSATTGTCVTAGFAAIFRSTRGGAGAGGVTPAFGAACSFGTVKLAKRRAGSFSAIAAPRAPGIRSAWIVGVA